MPHPAPRFLLPCLLAWAAASPAFAATVVYNNLNANPLGAYGELNSDNPVFGDALTLTQHGTLNTLVLSLYNPDYNSNTGSILAGTMYVNFFDNTVPYSGGSITDPLLGSAALPFDYTGAGGLPPGYYDDQESFDLTDLHIHLTGNILLTQQFVMTSGDSLYNGVTIYNAPVVGASPNYVYIKSDATPEGLYSFNGLPSQFGYFLTLTPDAAPAAPAPLPAAATGFLLLTGALGLWHTRRKIVRA